MKTKDKYFEMLRAYNESNITKIEKEFGKKYIFTSIVIISSIVFLISVNFFDKYINYIILILGILMIAVLTLYINQMKKKAIKKFGEEFKDFINCNKAEWLSIRALLFCEKLNNKGIQDTKVLIDIIEKELTLKNEEILKMPIFIGLLTIVSMLSQSIFDKLGLPSLFFILLVITLIIYFSYGLLSIFKTESAKMRELKLFLHWYDIFYLNHDK